MIQRRVFALGLLAFLPQLASAETLSYSILKEGEPIGKETYTLQRDGDHIVLQLSVESKVHILFLDFTYRHHRAENWTGDHLDKLVADTDDDGSKHHVEAKGTETGGITLTSDGKTLSVPADAFPLSMWRKAMIGHSTLFAVESDDTPYHVVIKDAGPETLIIGGQKIDCEHYAMTGDVDRELWYDAAGLLAKVSFRRRGFGISIVRDAIS